MAKRLTEEIELAEERFKKLFEIAPFGISVLDIKGFITNCNPAAFRHGGYSEKEIIGKHFSELAPLQIKDVPKYFQAFSNLLRGKPLEPMEIKYNRKDGSQGNTLIQATLLPESGGRLSILVFQRDITEQKKAEEDLKASRLRLRNLSARQQQEREDEKKHIAREIHDELGQALTALKIDLVWLRKKLPPEQVEADQKTRAMSELIDGTIDTVKRISSELRPSLLDDLGLVAAIEWQTEQFQKSSGIKCRVNRGFRSIRLGQERSMAVFRILQEALTNILRHANATETSIMLEKKGSQVIMKILDNGRGISAEEQFSPSSLGLIGMRERAINLDGELEINGQPGRGTMVTLKMPVKGRKNR